MKYLTQINFILFALFIFALSSDVYATGTNPDTFTIAQRDKDKGKTVKKKSGKEKSKSVDKGKSQENKKKLVKKPPQKDDPSRLPVYFAVFSALAGTGAVLGAAFFTNPPPGTRKMKENTKDDQFSESDWSGVA